AWLPIMQAYEARRPSYFATPATNHVLALQVGLQEILDDSYRGMQGVEARWARHADAASALHQAWSRLGLELVARNEVAAHTLSAILYPAGRDASLVQAINAQGLTVAGGLYPTLKDRYFRVGHMGWVITQPALLVRAVRAIGTALTGASDD